MSIKFKVQSLLWLDDWVDVGFFEDRKSATAFKDATKLAWPLHSFRVVSHTRPENALGRRDPERWAGPSLASKKRIEPGSPAPKRQGSQKSDNPRAGAGHRRRSR